MALDPTEPTTRSDPGARDPSPPLLKLLRALSSGAVAALVTWLIAHRLLDPESGAMVQEALMVLLMGILMATGAYARDRGWLVGRFFALPLALLLAGSLVACRTVTPRDAWRPPLATYSAAASGMAVYCDLPEADAESCIKAAKTTLYVEPVIQATQRAIKAGTATDAMLESSTAVVDAAIPTIQEVNP